MVFRAVIAGCGAMSRGWLKAIAETPQIAAKVEIVGLVDLDVAQADGLVADFGLSGVTTGADLNRVLEETKPDLVFDVVVPPARNDVVRNAFAHKCHVLSEKPMAVSMDEARGLIAAADAAGLVHAITQNRRHVAGVQRIRKFVSSGGLGALTSVNCDFFLGPHFGGFRDEMDHVLLLDMAIHTFDAARFMSSEEPLAVYCRESNPTGSWYSHGASAHAIFEMSNDVTLSYRGSWCAEGFMTSWEAAWRIVGTKGTIIWDGAGILACEVAKPNDGFFSEVVPVDLPEQPIGFLEGHAGIIDDFLTSLENGVSPKTINTDNIKSLAMVFGAIESAETQKRVEISH